MGTVIGPISQIDWNLMRKWNTSLKVMRRQPLQYAAAIEDEQKRFEKRKKKYGIGEEAA